MVAGISGWIRRKENGSTCSGLSLHKRFERSFDAGNRGSRRAFSMKGYAGTLLRVNLSTGHIAKVPTDAYADLFLGGRGIAARVHWDEVPPGCDALDPENRLTFMTGLICGVPGFSGSRWEVCGKSPIHEQFSYANLGGSWGAQLKFAGYDGLVVEGKADGPVYLWVSNDGVEIRDAAHLRGMGAIATRKRLKEELGKSARVAAVGPAGENRVTFATLLADNDSSGSSGLGAVMGSKNLKAIAVRGQGKVETADKTKLKKEVCYGCIDGCVRKTYEGPEGQRGKFFCQPSCF